MLKYIILYLKAVETFYETAFPYAKRSNACTAHTAGTPDTHLPSSPHHPYKFFFRTLQFKPQKKIKYLHPAGCLFIPITEYY